jgi:hydroxymethylpyrimidine/phosphomethylpyrimidine kinase
MVATSGDRLMKPDAVELIAKSLMPLASLITPNIHEAEVLTGLRVRSIEEMRDAGRALREHGARAILIKGGHIPPMLDNAGVPFLSDLLFDADEEHVLRMPVVATTSTHGTGCTLSSAIAANLALGRGMRESVELAQRYLHAALAAAPGVGSGQGPVLHRVVP